MEQGEDAFRRKHFEQLRRSLEVAAIVKPHFVRLIAGKLYATDSSAMNRVGVLQKGYPWVRRVYREAIQTIQDAGFSATIENEAHDCFLAKPADFVAFAEWLDLPGLSTSLTWDIQNNWQMGSFPSIDAYNLLSPYVGYIHLKGGQAAPDGSLKWASSLADASWPVVEITEAVLRDRVSPVICLNPSHGVDRPGPGRNLPSVTRQDVDFLRANVRGIQ